jgi:hypothetical protein
VSQSAPDVEAQGQVQRLGQVVVLRHHRRQVTQQQLALAHDEILVRFLELRRARTVHVGEGLRADELFEDQGAPSHKLVEPLGKSPMHRLSQYRGQTIGHGLLQAAMQPIDVAEQPEDRSHPDPRTDGDSLGRRGSIPILQKVHHGRENALPARLGPGSSAIDRRTCQGALHRISRP